MDTAPNDLDADDRNPAGLAARPGTDVPAAGWAARPRPDGKPVLLVYSNCQAEEITRLVARIPAVREAVTVRYLFMHDLALPGSGWDTYPDDYMDGVELLWEQASEAFPAERAELNRRLPPGIRRIRFPAATTSAIWPFFTPDPRTSRRPYYHYGDAVAASVGKEIGDAPVSDDAVFDRYMRLSAERMPNLERRVELDLKLWRRRDADADVGIADFMQARLRTDQLFPMPIRIGTALMRHLTVRLLEETFSAAWLAERGVIAEIDRMLRFYVNKDNISMPVHPLVAERLALQWYDPDAAYPWFGHAWTFRDWVVRCARFEPYMDVTF